MALRNYTLLFVVAAVWVVFQALTGIFLSPRNLTLLALQSSITAMAAISAVMLIVTRNFDVSVGSAVALVGVVAAVATSPTKLALDPLVGFALAMIVGIVLGAWNGLWVTRIGVPSFIVTLAGLLYFRGISMIITNGATVSPVPPAMRSFGNDSLGPGLSVAVVVLVFLAFAAFRISTIRRARDLGLLRDVRPVIIRSLVPVGVAA
ncbi:MAG: sugar ABC transporter permease, partial [Chloroflexota bacterium]|nr:sugar ABC transporter permease [Chloroflexota bacterium]